MIKSIKHKGLSKFFTKGDKRQLNAKDLPKITRVLDRLDSAVAIQDMNIPGWNLHELKGNRKGVWSVAIQKNWKITFMFERGDAYDVSLEDYH